MLLITFGSFLRDIQTKKVDWKHFYIKTKKNLVLNSHFQRIIFFHRGVKKNCCCENLRGIEAIFEMVKIYINQMPRWVILAKNLEVKILQTVGLYDTHSLNGIFS